MFAKQIAQALEGCCVGARWMARCPAHDDQTPSLSIQDNDGKVLLHCHAGCDQTRVIEELRKRGLWVSSCATKQWQKTCRSLNTRAQFELDLKRSKAALDVWNSAQSAKGTLVETYLASRGITLPTPDTLRFQLGLKHPTRGIWPAMVALVSHGNSGSPVAIHRTFLSRDGLGKAPVKPQKMMLGPCRGGVVRLGDPGDILMVGEGIETCLAAMQASGYPAWAALSTSGLRSLELPNDLQDVIILADGDDAGEAAARACAVRWHREKGRVRIARPPQGMDFNDLLLRGRSVPVGVSE